MTQKLVTFSNSVLRVDSATIYECWKSGDIVDVHFDGQTHFVSADMLHDLASEGLIHQDGICGKGWVGSTKGFCNRVKKIKEWDKKRTEEFQALSPEEKKKRVLRNGATAAVVAGSVAFLSEKGNRRILSRNLNNFARKAGESAGRTASKYKRRGGSQASQSIGALPAYMKRA